MMPFAKIFVCLSITLLGALSSDSFAQKLSNPYIALQTKKAHFRSGDIQLTNEHIESDISPEILAQYSAIDWARDTCEQASTPHVISLLQKKPVGQFLSSDDSPRPFNPLIPNIMQPLKDEVFPGNLGVMAHNKREHSIDCKSVGFESFYGVILPETTHSFVVENRRKNTPMFGRSKWHYELAEGEYKGMMQIKTTCEARPNKERRVLTRISNCYKNAKKFLKERRPYERPEVFSKRQNEGSKQLQRCAALVRKARQNPIEATKFLEPEAHEVCQEISFAG